MRRPREGAAAVAVLVALIGCADVPTPGPPRSEVVPPDPDAASLLLVTLDTFRADAAGCGGHPRGRTPHLDRLARGGVQFETGLAATPLTAPSHASLLTGLDPPAHGVRDNALFRLGQEVPTIAESLASRGFATAAFVTAFPLDPRFGFSRGFSVFDAVDVRNPQGLSIAQRPGGEAVEAARRWWTGPGDATRWFVWIHLFDAHAPHEAPEALQRACGHPYLGDVAWADHFLGRALATASTTGRPHWVVVLGDHGESLGDHGESSHGLFVYGATMRVPAVVWPAPAGSVPGLRRDVFRLVDFPRTAFRLLGLTVGDTPGGGNDALDEGTPAAYLESRYASYHYGWAPLAALQQDDWKYVAAPEPELYDLAADPGERDNVIGRHPDRASRMAARLDSIEASAVASGPTSIPRTLDGHDREALAALGYVTGRAAHRADAPDPKRMIAVEQWIARAQALIGTRDLDAAGAVLRQALARDPRNKELHQLFGQLHALAGRDARAVDSFRQALSLPPHVSDRVPRFELARAYLRLGKPAEAIGPLETILREDPEDAPTWYNLGVAHEQAGNLARAREAWERALASDPGFALAEAALTRTGSRGRTDRDPASGS